MHSANFRYATTASNECTCLEGQSGSLSTKLNLIYRTPINTVVLSRKYNYRQPRSFTLGEHEQYIQKAIV